MAVTGHWLEEEEIASPGSPGGTRHILRLRSALIGFQRLTGAHTGAHMAQSMIYVLDRVGIVEKVSHYLIRLSYFLA
jgi:hypothetical protein